MNESINSPSEQQDEVLVGVVNVLVRVLQVDKNSTPLNRSTQLLGAIPELDSMAVLTVLTSIEEEFGIVIDDDDVSAATFESVDSLVKLVDSKA